jgi:hypothetical protein
VGSGFESLLRHRKPQVNDLGFLMAWQTMGAEFSQSSTWPAQVGDAHHLCCSVLVHFRHHMTAEIQRGSDIGLTQLLLSDLPVNTGPEGKSRPSMPQSMDSHWCHVDAKCDLLPRETRTQSHNLRVSNTNSRVLNRGRKGRHVRTYEYLRAIYRFDPDKEGDDFTGFAIWLKNLGDAGWAVITPVQLPLEAKQYDWETYLWFQRCLLDGKPE